MATTCAEPKSAGSLLIEELQSPSMQEIPLEVFKNAQLSAQENGNSFGIVTLDAAPHGITSETEKEFNITKKILIPGGYVVLMNVPGDFIVITKHGNNAEQVKKTFRIPVELHAKIKFTQEKAQAEKEVKVANAKALENQRIEEENAAKIKRAEEEEKEAAAIEAEAQRARDARVAKAEEQKATLKRLQEEFDQGQAELATAEAEDQLSQLKKEERAAQKKD